MNPAIKGRTLAVPMTISVYPHERDALLRIMHEKKLKSVFDVVRFLASQSRSRFVRAEDFCLPKEKS
jgi:hypothetical protein